MLSTTEYMRGSHFATITNFVIYEPPTCLPSGEHLVRGHIKFCMWDNLLFTCMQAPVITLESGLARKTKAGASSAGCAARPCIGIPTPNPSMSSVSLDAGWRAVMTGPGATAFTRMPLGANCFERERVKDMIAPFVAE